MMGAIGAVVAGAIGAGIWAAIAYFTGYENAYVALGIGFLVGFGAAKLGGASPATGVLCAVVALASILGGKMLATKFSLDKAMASTDEFVIEQSANVYSQYAASAEQLPGEESYAQFMVDDGWIEVENSADVSAEDLASFKSEWVPFLKDIQSGKVTQANWQETTVGQNWRTATDAAIAEEIGNTSLIDAVKESLGAIDLLFAFLGVATAFKVGRGGSDEA